MVQLYTQLYTHIYTSTGERERERGNRLPSCNILSGRVGSSRVVCSSLALFCLVHSPNAHNDPRKAKKECTTSRRSVRHHDGNLILLRRQLFIRFGLGTGTQHTAKASTKPIKDTSDKNNKETVVRSGGPMHSSSISAARV